MRIHVCGEPDPRLGEDCYELEVSSAVVDVLLERINEDKEWGGPENDDAHTPIDWLRYINKQMQRAKASDGTPWPGNVNETYRDRLIKVGALAIAAIESYDR